MVLTLLEYVQSVLSDLNSDTVNTVGETPEAVMVGQIVRDTYFNMLAEREWNWAKFLGTLTGLGDLDNPTKMRMPTDGTKVLWIKYNLKDVTFKEPKTFQDMIDGRDLTADNITDQGYFTDRDPVYWTTYDDDYIIFDSYDSDEESTLQTSNSTAYYVKDGTWTVEDDFEPLIPVRMVPTLLSGAKSAAFLIMKQAGNSREERMYKQGMARAHTEADKAKALEFSLKSNSAVDYGRKR
jgi:hypothetical protein